ncbi:hypothetical protein BDB00DRAFT_841801, partial [Zychaea mexicana]|uniref:uncharacterized protein n=1 Tax=Zychaea mexicana TaxID=64656 RepID=UPI0022FE536E
MVMSTVFGTSTRSSLIVYPCKMLLVLEKILFLLELVPFMTGGDSIIYIFTRMAVDGDGSYLCWFCAAYTWIHGCDGWMWWP